MTQTDSRPPRRGALVILLLLAAFAPAAAQDEPTGIAISPPRAEHDLTTREVELSFRFANHTEGPVALPLRLTGLGHDLDGAPLFPEPDPDATALSLSAPALDLAPGAFADVAVTGAIPDGQAGLYGAVVATVGEGGAGQVGVTTQLAGVILLRGPRPWVEQIDIVDAGVQTTAGRREAVLYADVEDTGDVHVRPAGRFEVYDADGQRLGEVEVGGEVILPGYARRLRASWTPPAGALDGPLRLVTALTSPDAGDDRTVEPEVVSDLEFGESTRLAAEAAEAARVQVATEGGGAPRVTTFEILVIVAVALLVLLTTALVAVWLRRRQPAT